MQGRVNLPEGMVVDGSYRIARVVGSGGFGITYEAEDITLGITVALKEYYPDEFGDRDARMSVQPKSERHKQTFEWGRANFLKEARALARFDHPSIVRVTRVFEANSTAYMVMSFERGQSFEAWLKGLGRPPTQEELDVIVIALLDALRIMHAADFLHRDIAPDNIIVRADGSPVLLDFGSARRAVAEMSRSLTGIVKAGYSPHEQYSSNSRLQGPWSDIYAFGGTLYRAATGHPPEEATLRVNDDRMAPATLAAKGNYRRGFLAAIDACLMVRQVDRPQSVTHLQPMLLESGHREEQRSGPPAMKVRKVPTPSRHSVSTPHGPAPSRARRWAMVAAVMGMIAASIYGGYQFRQWRLRGEAAAQAQYKAAAAAQRQAALELERRQKDAADAAKQQADLEAQRRQQLEAERVAVQEAARRRAEEKRKDDERLQTASRAQLIKLPVKLGNLPTDENKAWLGVDTEPLDLPSAHALGLANANGAFVFNKRASGPADRAGIRIGDVIVGMNREIASTSDLRQQLASLAPGSEALVEVWRAAANDGDFLPLVRRLAEGGDAHAMYRLGRMYARGIGITRDDLEAATWYRKGADAGDSNAIGALGIALLDGRGVAKDRQEGLRLVRAAAARGQVEAAHRLGQVLHDGKIVAKDLLEAARLFTRAAEDGYAPSMVALGQLYAAGLGMQTDPAKAVFWYQRAVDLGHAGGLAGLGSLYENGRGVKMDIARAVTLYRRAADLGNAGAMTNLGQLLWQGKGVAKNDEAAAALFRKATDLGNPVAMNNLAWMLQAGDRGLRKDPQEAADFMMKALSHGNEFSHKQMTQNLQSWSKEFRLALQSRLRDAGFYAGPIDGNFREPTIAAINAYVGASPTLDDRPKSGMEGSCFDSDPSSESEGTAQCAEQ